jgi:hypothetical protein
MKITDNLEIKNISNDPVIVKYLQEQDFFYVTDISLLSKERFVKRHADYLFGQAETIYDKALNISQQCYMATLVKSTSTANGSVSFSPSAKSSEFNYQTLFQEDWSRCCHPDSIFSQDSPAAYLAYLYRFAKQLDGDRPTGSLSLDERRPDLKELVINNSHRHEEKAMLTQVNAILKKTIQDRLGKSKPVEVDRALATLRYPFEFPYDHTMEQIKLGLKERGVELAYLREQLQEEYPYYYLQGTDNDYVTPRTLQLAYNDWSPEQYRLLLEPQLFQSNTSGTLTQQARDYFLKNYGQKIVNNTSFNEVIQQFNSLDKFSQITGLSPQEIYYLIPDQDFIQHGVSTNCPNTHYTNSRIVQTYARYIHRKGDSTSSSSEIDSNSKKIKDLNYLILERCDRLIRLRQWTGWSYIELNELFTALEWATVDNTYQNDSFLRMLGMLRRLKRQFPSLTVQQFIAFCWMISPYTHCDRSTSFFDNLFNASTQAPLVLDAKSTFNPEKTDDISVKQTLESVCAGVRLATSELPYLCQWLSKDLFKNKTLLRELECISKLYRCVQLPRLFGWEFKEGLCLFDLLDSRAVSLLGSYDDKPSRIHLDKNNKAKHPDLLDIIQQLFWATTWLKHIACQPSELVEILDTPRSGNLPRSLPIDQVKPVISGLIPFRKDVLNALNKEQYAHNTSVISLSEQEEVTLLTMLADYFELDSAPLMRSVLEWADIASHFIFKIPLASSDSSDKIQRYINAHKLEKLLRYVKFVKRFKLTPPLIIWLCKNPEQWDSSSKSSSLDIKLIYLVSRFKDFVLQSQQDEVVCIEYFTFANKSGALPEHCHQKLAKLMAWESHEIEKAQTKGKFATTLKEVDYLMRLQQWSKITGLPVSALQKAAQLEPENINKSYAQVVTDYEAVASAILTARRLREKDNK